MPTLLLAWKWRAASIGMQGTSCTGRTALLPHLPKRLAVG